MSPARPIFDPTSGIPDFLNPIADISPPAPLQFPKFPTPADLLSHAAGHTPHPLVSLSETAPPRASASLFHGLMGGNLQTLVADSTDHPERYSAETQLFLAELGAGTRQVGNLSPAEKAHLDSAVLDFASYKPPQLAPRPPRPAMERVVRSSAARGNPYEAGLPDSRAPQVEIPGGVMSSYWWVSGDKA